MTSANGSTSSDNDATKCAICFEVLLKDSTKTLPCEHSFHKNCIKQVRIKTCPLCREPFEENINETLIVSTMTDPYARGRKARFYAVICISFTLSVTIALIISLMEQPLLYINGTSS